MQSLIRKLTAKMTLKKLEMVRQNRRVIKKFPGIRINKT